MTRYLLLSVLIVHFSVCIWNAAFSQGVKISTNPGNPHPSAMLEVGDSTAGFLPPRLTTGQRNAIQSPAIGLMIYNITTECFEGYFSAGWKTISCNCTSYPSSAFTASTLNPGQNLGVTFSVTNPVQGDTYQWTFNGGNPASSTQQNPVVQWSTQGTYWVVFTATNNQGCSATDSVQITVTACSGSQGQQLVFSYTGSVQQWTVPAGVCSITAQCYGAQGSNGSTGSPGGNGGLATGTFTVTPGEILEIYVGGQVGWNGGGTGNTGGGNGGGASDVRQGGSGLNNRVIVAGGGGGGGATNGNAPGGIGGGGTCASNYCGGGGGKGANNQSPPVGGANGGLAGGAGGVGNGSNNGGAGGGGGFQSGGLGGTNSGFVSGVAGVLGLGGNGGGVTGAGAGGGGYYGGGGAAGGANSNAGGGGGSSWTGSCTSPVMTAGVRSGNGQITIFW